MHELKSPPISEWVTDSVERPLEWIQVSKDSPYFVTERGAAWLPIGQNDSYTWPDLAGVYARRDISDVERHLVDLRNHGVTCLRLMLEYCEGANHYFEDPAGTWDPTMVQMWDDLFALCEKYGLRILLTPFDTFWMWIRWEYHPYNRMNGGPCEDRTQFMVCPRTREFIKRRLGFATERWGSSGALFAWDLWNEIHPAYAADEAQHFAEFVDDVGSYLRDSEIKLFGRAHPQTVSVYGPLIAEGFEPQTFTVFTPVIRQDPTIAECIFAHPRLDFASVHFYEEGTIDDPQNTVDAALSIGKLVRQALERIRDRRPLLDSEYGPIHSFKDRHITLPAPFDDEYSRHIQWAHIASGEVSGGMRWPNRQPHTLTPGMRKNQAALSRFLPLINWARFDRQNWNDQVSISLNACRGMACGDGEQAIVWLVRTDSIRGDGMLQQGAEPIAPMVHLPEMHRGTCRVTAWDTRAGAAVIELQVEHPGGPFAFQSPPIATDMALAIRWMP